MSAAVKHKEEQDMDMREYIGDTFYRLSDMPPKGQTLKDTIADVVPSKYSGKVDLLLGSGMKLSLNRTNVRELAKHFGLDSKDWAGKPIELYNGQLRNENGDWQDGVRLSAVNQEALTILRDKANSSVPAQLPAPVDASHPSETPSDDDIGHIPF
jgi:hypothetical protein